MKTTLLKRLVCLCLSFSLIMHVAGSNYYVSTIGNDNNPGTYNQPYGTIGKAVSMVSAGDSIFIQGGIYSPQQTIEIAIDGAEDNQCTLMGYGLEEIIIDFSQIDKGVPGIELSASHWTLEGLILRNAVGNGLLINGGVGNSIINCTFHSNGNSGLELDNGAAGNRIIHCDSYNNADFPEFDFADGFTLGRNAGTGNYFIYCRAWKNCDSGWDGSQVLTENVQTFLTSCWAFDNGTLADGGDVGPAAKGNGFTLGGSTLNSSCQDFKLVRCLASMNTGLGFDQRLNNGQLILLHCSAHNNIAGNYHFMTSPEPPKVIEVKNCLSVGERGDLESITTDDHNSWMASVMVSDDDFISMDATEALSSRQQDGTLPDINYLHLAMTSDLIDAGVDVGLIYNGIAPDLGCFEAGLLYGLKAATEAGRSIRIAPNPAKEEAWIIAGFESAEDLSVVLYDLSGRACSNQFISVGFTEGRYRLDLSGIQPGTYIIGCKTNRMRYSELLIVL